MSDEKQVVPTQADRDTYEAYVRLKNGDDVDEDEMACLRAGERDGLHGVQIATFARHRLAAEQSVKVGEWCPRVGEEVRPAPHIIDEYPYYAEERFFVAGVITEQRGRKGINVWISHEWPTSANSVGYTDGFYIQRPFKPDDLLPIATLAHPQTVVEDVEMDWPREKLARLALSRIFGFQYEGESLCDEAERIFKPANPRAIRAVKFADEIITLLAASCGGVS